MRGAVYGCMGVFRCVCVWMHGCVWVHGVVWVHGCVRVRYGCVGAYMCAWESGRPQNPPQQLPVRRVEVEKSLRDDEREMGAVEADSEEPRRGERMRVGAVETSDRRVADLDVADLDVVVVVVRVRVRVKVRVSDRRV